MSNEKPSITPAHVIREYQFYAKEIQIMEHRIAELPVFEVELINYYKDEMKRLEVKRDEALR